MEGKINIMKGQRDQRSTHQRVFHAHASAFRRDDLQSDCAHEVRTCIFVTSAREGALHRVEQHCSPLFSLASYLLLAICARGAHDWHVFVPLRGTTLLRAAGERTQRLLLTDVKVRGARKQKENFRKGKGVESGSKNRLS